MVASFVASAVLLVAFVISQLLQKSPMFDLGLLRKPTFVGGLVAAFGVSASVFSVLTYLIIYVQNVLGFSRGRRPACGSCSCPGCRSWPRSSPAG